jgi:transcription initiation factor TFIIIB Brf1 subunit/transcription initiation factor TFIIB
LKQAAVPCQLHGGGVSQTTAGSVTPLPSTTTGNDDKAAVQRDRKRREQAKRRKSREAKAEQRSCKKATAAVVDAVREDQGTRPSLLNLIEEIYHKGGGQTRSIAGGVGGSDATYLFLACRRNNNR